MPEYQFNPNEHLIQIKSQQGPKDYLPAQWRVVWFRFVYPEGSVETEMLHLDLDRDTEEETLVWNAEQRRNEKIIKQAKGFVVFKAVVKDGKGGIGTGTKSEKAASFPDFIEKAECVPLDSEILTRRGFKKYDELTIGEEVLAYDNAQDICVWTPLQRVVTYDNAHVVRLHGKTFEAICTPEHTWATYASAVQDTHKYEYRKLTKTHELHSYHSIMLAAPAPNGDYPLTPRDAAILGWLITDGSIQQKGNSVRSYICQSKQQNVQVIRELVGALAKETVSEPSTRQFPRGHTSECLPQHRFTFSADETRRIFQAAGIEQIEDLPAMVTRYSHEARQAMLTAMMLADGDKRGNFGKKRKHGVMETWQILATLEGFALGSMRMSTVGDVPLQRLKARRRLCASELQIEDADTCSVWCPTTQYGTWIMRQNGRIMITGNTGAIGRALAALGYGTQFTGDEWDEAHRIVDSPVDQAAQLEEIASIKKDWAATYNVADANIEERWGAFVVWVLGKAVADADLKSYQIKKLKGGIEEQKRVRDKGADSTEHKPAPTPAKIPAKLDADIKKRLDSIYDRALILQEFQKGETKEESGTAFFALLTKIIKAKVAAPQQLTASRLDTIEKYIAEKETARKSAEEAS